MSLFAIGKKFLNKYPKFKQISSNIYYCFFKNSKRTKGRNNIIKRNKSFLKKCKITIIGNDNYVDLGDECYLEKTKITIIGNQNKVILGKKTYINQGDIYFEDSNNELNIGDKCIFAGNVHLALTEGKKITIGDECLLSSNIVFRTGDSHSILDDKGERINRAKDINIKNHVWITQNVTVLKGSSIQENTVVATGSIVNKKFTEKNVIIGGNPSKVLKENVNWKNERI